MASIREQLDALVLETTSFNTTVTPAAILSNLKKWKWGSYGWVSPASLIFTATWRKYFYPSEDCYKIWAKDENNNPIEGGYSIRSEDESITIPVLAKYDLCNGYCSPNSGMQGSRAIEKMRNLKRINTDFDSAQRTIFDLKLFATILNQINNLTPEQALEVLKFQIIIAKNIKQKRLSDNVALQQTNTHNFDLMVFLSKTHDPELTKCVVAACFEALYSATGLKLEGVSDYKTAADARAQKPGDLSLSKDDTVIIAIEVKDKTQNIDWNNIDRAKKILVAHPSLMHFAFVLENRSATVTNVIQEMVSSNQLANYPCNKITFTSVHDLYISALSVVPPEYITKRTGYFMSITPAIKPETKTAWINETK